MPSFWWNPAPLTARLVGAARPAFIQTGLVAKKLAPRDTGLLAAKVRGIQVAPTVGAITATGVDYLAVVIGGAKPHKIDPPGNQALNTPYGPRASVQHPGMEGNPFMRKAAQAFPDLYVANARRAIRF